MQLSSSTCLFGRSGTLRATLALFAATLLVAPGAEAQDGKALPKLLTLPSIPSATTAPHGTIFFNIAGTNRRVETADDPDGSIALGVGFGSAEETVGLQATAYVTSLTDDFGDSGYGALKISRRIVGGSNPTYVALGADQLGSWGDSEGVDPRYAVALTTFANVSFGSAEQYPVMFTLAGGTDVRDNQTKPGVYAGGGIGITPYFGLGASWVGEYVDIGAAFLIPGLERLGITAAVSDVFDQEDRQRLVVSVNLIFDEVFGGKR